MLYVAPVHEDMRSVIPAVTHVDGTARLKRYILLKARFIISLFQHLAMRRECTPFSTPPST